MVYYKSHLEEYIESLYKSLGIDEPEQANYLDIGKQLNIKVKDHPESSTCLRIGHIPFILLNNQLNEQQKWQEFGHEVCHFLRHAGNQETLPFPFIQLQEFQANTFALHFCVPTFMLEKLELPFHRRSAVLEICRRFNVEYSFAEERLGWYEIQMMGKMMSKSPSLY